MGGFFVAVGTEDGSTGTVGVVGDKVRVVGDKVRVVGDKIGLGETRLGWGGGKVRFRSK